jgi:hypothetical protein
MTVRCYCTAREGNRKNTCLVLVVSVINFIIFISVSRKYNVFEIIER